ncbi:hypothetical protein LSAT2_008312 [Lamellibrachia satsuma]|nr:hypothetical protein LSAT2_008312 [Lamellibrachia satsuma]
MTRILNDIPRIVCSVTTNLVCVLGCNDVPVTTTSLNRTRVVTSLTVRRTSVDPLSLCSLDAPGASVTRLYIVVLAPLPPDAGSSSAYLSEAAAHSRRRVALIVVASRVNDRVRGSDDTVTHS